MSVVWCCCGWCVLSVALCRSSVAALYCLCFRSVLLVGERGGALRSKQPKGWKTARPAGHTAKEKSNERGDRGNTGWLMGFLHLMGRTALRLSHLIAYKSSWQQGVFPRLGVCISPLALATAPARVRLPPLYRYCTGIVSALYRYCIGIASVLYRCCIGVVSVLYRK